MSSNDSSVKKAFNLKLSWLLGLVIAATVFHAEGSRSCTIAVSTDGRTVMAGNNEDYVDPRTALWFIPATDETYGRVLWGYDRYLYPYQGGMNDRDYSST